MKKIFKSIVLIITILFIVRVEALEGKFNLKITQNNDLIKLSWDKIDDAIEYEIYMSTSKNGNYDLLVDDYKLNEYTKDELSYGRTYYFKVTAKNGYDYLNSNTVSSKISLNKVTKFKAKKASSSSITLSYNKAQADGYEIYRSTKKSKGFKKIKTINDNEIVVFNDTKLKNNKVYYYKIRAFKIVDNKKIYSAYSSVVSKKTGPKKPSISLGSKGLSTIKVKVKKVTGAIKYQIYRSTDENNDFKLIKTIKKAGTYKNNVEPNKKYYYKVRACNNKTCSDYTKVLSKKLSVKAPSTFKLSASNKNNISWSKVSNVKGYKLYRSNEENGEYTLIKTTNKLKFSDSVNSSTTYYYKLRSYVNVNNKNYYSPYTKVLNGQTISIKDAEKLVDNITIPVWTKGYNTYFTGKKIYSKDLSNDLKLMFATLKLSNEKSGYTASKEEVEKTVKELFGNDTSVTHKTFSLGSCYAQSATLDRNTYIFDGGCGGPGPIDSYVNKTTKAIRYSDRIEVVQKIAYITYPDWDFDKVKYTRKVFTNYNKKKLITKFKGDYKASFNFNKFSSKLDSYKYVFKKENNNYYFYSVEKVK